MSAFDRARRSPSGQVMSSDSGPSYAGGSSASVAAGPIKLGGSGDLSDVAQGRLSLALLEGIAVGLILFYLYTHSLQKGL